MSVPICPVCQTPLVVPTAGDDLATCPNCNKQYRLKTKPDNFPEMDRTGQQSPPARMRFSWPIALAGGCVLFLLAGVTIWMIKGNEPSTTTAQTNVDGGKVEPASQAPPADSAAEDSGGLIDLTELMELDDTSVQSNVPESSTNAAVPIPSHDVATTPAAMESVPGAFGGLQFVSLQGGRIQVDGVSQDKLFDWRIHGAMLSVPAPAGRHLVAYPRQVSRTIESSGFASHYLHRKEAVTQGGEIDLSELQRQLIAAKGIFEDPILPHLLGNAYWQAEHLDSAVRFWNAAVLLAPGYAPSHLNLAYAYWQRGDQPAARRELGLATALNIQDTFGIGRHLVELAGQIEVDQSESMAYSRRDYLPTGTSATSGKVVRVLEAVNILADKASDRAACLNNAGIFLMSEAQQPDLAVAFFIRAQQELREGESDEHIQYANTIVTNLARASEQAQLPEADLFARLANSMRTR